MGACLEKNTSSVRAKNIGKYHKNSDTPKIAVIILKLKQCHFTKEFA